MRPNSNADREPSSEQQAAPEDRAAGAGSSIIMAAFTHLNPEGGRADRASPGSPWSSAPSATAGPARGSEATMGQRKSRPAPGLRDFQGCPTTHRVYVQGGTGEPRTGWGTTGRGSSIPKAYIARRPPRKGAAAGGFIEANGGSWLGSLCHVFFAVWGDRLPELTGRQVVGSEGDSGKRSRAIISRNSSARIALSSSVNSGVMRVYEAEAERGRASTDDAWPGTRCQGPAARVARGAGTGPNPI